MNKLTAVLVIIGAALTALHDSVGFMQLIPDTAKGILSAAVIVLAYFAKSPLNPPSK